MTLQQARAGIVRWYALFDGINPSWVRYVTAMAIGMMIALTVGLADTNGDWLTMVIAVDGFIIAFISSRLLDAFSETRQTRRRVYLALLRIRRLNRELALLLEENRDGPGGAGESRWAAAVGRMAAIGLNSQAAPDFDEIIDTNEDLAAATRAHHAFQALHALFGTPLPRDNPGATVGTVLSPEGLRMLAEHHRALNEASAHLERRLGKATPFTSFTIEEETVPGTMKDR